MPTPRTKPRIEAVNIPLPYAVFWCPGCKMRHTIGDNLGKLFYWNGSPEKPTIRPMANIIGNGLDGKTVRCSFIITAGVIEFINSNHELNNKRLALPKYTDAQPRSAKVVNTVKTKAT